MDYATFVARGEPTWDRMAALADRGVSALGAHELEELVATHRAVVSDFAWARTRFPEAAATSRLRGLAFLGHQLLAAPEVPPLTRAWRFFSHGFPATFRRELPAVAAGVALFVGGTLLGCVVGTTNPDMARLFVDEEALQGLREGRIWTDQVGDRFSASALSTLIFTNNIKVGLIAWAGGALAGLPTSAALLFNGLMFGSLLVVAWRYGLLDRLNAWIAAHGPLELTLICVAGGAGFALARGWADDQGRPRGEALAEAGRRSVRLALGTIPWFVLCGIVEGGISPRMDLDTGLKAALGFALLAVFLLYALVPRRPGAPA
jgi:uncharacterized membrane protein SpoIIM required for sporulation